jgi:hypothetical protein
MVTWWEGNGFIVLLLTLDVITDYVGQREIRESHDYLREIRHKIIFTKPIGF